MGGQDSAQQVAKCASINGITLFEHDVGTFGAHSVDGHRCFVLITADQYGPGSGASKTGRHSPTQNPSRADDDRDATVKSKRGWFGCVHVQVLGVRMHT